MNPRLVEVASLQYRYPDGTEALHGVSFRIAPGESVGLVGANGSGKSTLLSHLNGLLLPTHGSVHVSGQRVEPGSLDAVRRTVGMVFQDPDDQLFMPTVLEDVAFGPLNQGRTRAEAERAALQALEAVGSADLLSRAPHRLSLGQRSSVAIAAVLAMEPEILVLDEPAGRLDPRARRRLIQLLGAFRHTKLIASHDLDLVAELCPRVLVLDHGRLVADGPTSTLLADAALLQAHGLELPLGRQPLPDGPPPQDRPPFVWNPN